MRQRAKLAVFVVSAAVFAGAWLTAESAVREPEAAEAMAEPEEVIDLSAGSRSELIALSWSWEGETVNLEREEATGLWRDAEDPSCPLDPAAAEALARAASSVTASLAVEGATELAQYGLAPAGLTVIAATADRIVTYEVGNMSITGAYYTRVDGSDTVYLADGSLAAFRTALDDLLALETLPEDVTAVTGLAVRSEAESYTLAYRTAEGAQPGWYRTDGENPLLLESDRVQELVEAVFATELTRCVTWRAEDAARFGVDEPQLTVTVSYTTAAGRAASFTLAFGAYEGNDIYVSLAGSDLVYLTGADPADALMYPAWERLVPAAVMTLDTEAVASVTVELGGGRYELLRLEEPAPEDGDTPPEVIYSLNGRVLDTERTEAWLQSLAGLPAELSSPPGEGRQTLLRLTVVWKDPESVPAELELRRYDSVHGLAVLNGDRYLLVPRSGAEAALAEAEDLLAGEP